VLKREVAEILVEGQQNTLFAHGTLENIGILAARSVGTDPRDVVAGAANSLHRVEGKILVGQKLHEGTSGRLKSVELFLAERLGRIGPAGEQVFPRQAWIVAQDFSLRPAVAQQAKQEVDAQARPLDHWLSDQDIWINNDPLVMIHDRSKRRFDLAVFAPRHRHL
jgi:hypothetical protein